MAKKFLIMHQTITTHDAIGNDIENMYNIINKKFECRAYASNKFNKNIKYLENDEINSWINDKNTVIIYHHSVYWEEGEKIIKQFPGTVIIRYHNITPPTFFAKYNMFHTSQCKKGREQTISLAKNLKNAYWLSDSLFNTIDIQDDVSNDRIEILPPFNNIEKWAASEVNEKILSELVFSKNLNVLFVGRIAPNKGYTTLIETIRYYRNSFDNNIKLRIIGKFDEGLTEYNELLISLIQRYKLNNNIQFIGEINDSILMSYYLGSDIFLCASEHEGFCVPIIESQYFKLPIVAVNECAIPDTIGKNQLLFRRDPKLLASALYTLKSNPQWRIYLRENGILNFNKYYTYSVIKNKFISIIGNWCGVKL